MQPDPKVLETIRELLDAIGAQCFAEIQAEVRTQVGGSVRESHEETKTALKYLIELGTVIEHQDEFGIVYGYDF